MKLFLHFSLFSSVFFFTAIVYGQNKYVGVRACRPCHATAKQGEQFPIWQKSAHARAYTTLTTSKADEIAKGIGFSVPAVEVVDCLTCHTVLADTKLLEKTFSVQDGVQCETCHGAGSAYKSMSIMKDHAKSVAAGMIEYIDEAAIEKQCRSCHNEKSPTYKEFKFKESWEKIKHPVPKSG